MRRVAALAVGFIAVIVVTLLGAAGAVAKDRYVDPFADSLWIAGRTDMGMDWAPLKRLPVLAIGDGVVLGADNRSDWPGHHFLFYQPTGGSHAGDIIYVAEHLTKLVRTGTVVHPGQQLAVAVPGYPYIETGWADAYGSPRAAPCYREGHRTNSGREMERFLISLGAPAGDPPGRGPNRPAGKRC